MPRLPIAICFSVVYNIIMALAVERRGRPRYVADYTWKNALVQSYYDEFYNACHTLTYREMVALSRLLGFSLRTIYRWKNDEDFPRHIEAVLVVLEWTKRGKPIRQETQAEVAHNQTMW